MTEYLSPVPNPSTGAASPGIYRGIYGMPMFVTVPTSDLAESADFWIRGLGFVDLFSIPGRLTHLRRWAFQDVLLVPTGRPDDLPALSVSFSCVLGEIDQLAAACEAVRPGCTTAPQQTPWNSVEFGVVTPENARVTMTAARPFDAARAEMPHLETVHTHAASSRD